MLLVDGEPVSPSSSSSSSSGSSPKVHACVNKLVRLYVGAVRALSGILNARFLQGSCGRELVAALMGSPGLCAASDRLRAAPERRISAGPEGPRHVYVFQREYATVDPARVELVGTDEVTTCVGVVIRNKKTGMTSISHMDFPRIVEGGLKQMLELLGDDNAPFDVHLIGGFNDASAKVVHSSGRKHSIQEGYSYPLCCKIVEALHKSQKQFHLLSFCVLENNTTTDSYGNARPIIGGFMVQTSSGVVAPASFDMMLQQALT